MSNELILNKIKLLLNLAQSPNENEALAARSMADKLIEKYQITEEDLKSIEDKKPAYGEEQKLYSTLGIESWRNQLALGICTKYDCYLLQEEAVPTEGISSFGYYVIGEPSEVANVKFTFDVLEKKVEALVLKNCTGRGPIYIHSYSEGLVEGIKSNLDFVYFEVAPAVNMPGPAATLNTGNECITKDPGIKEKPLKESINIASQSFIKDVQAYFKGLSDGNRVSLQSELELAQENKQPEKLKE